MGGSANKFFKLLIRDLDIEVTKESVKLYWKAFRNQLAVKFARANSGAMRMGYYHHIPIPNND